MTLEIQPAPTTLSDTLAATDRGQIQLQAPDAGVSTRPYPSLHGLQVIDRTHVCTVQYVHTYGLPSRCLVTGRPWWRPEPVQHPQSR